ncbi:hypothetical protein [Vampirovibrio sp.]|uniref:hypothetical protein n=1 Tax=Vampirovibrio sp. TaxID=2717857 RepID=UPI0035937459
MSDRCFNLLETAQARIALLVKLGNRLLAGILLMGGLFCVMSIMFTQLLKQPEQALQLQAFAFNYSDFAKVEKGRVLSARETTSPENAGLEDPNWDGTLAGASLGLAVGRDLPVIGWVIGPVVGAMLGYQLDSHI